MVEGRLVFDITPTGNAGDRRPVGRQALGETARPPAIVPRPFLHTIQQYI
jgi:hypothetical protein